MGDLAPVHLFRRAGGRHAEHLARYRRPAHGEMDRWPRAPDYWRGSGSEPGGFGRRNEAGLYGDVEQDKAVGLSFRRRPPAASPVNRLPLLAAAREKSISTYGQTDRRSRIRQSGLAATSCGNDRLWPERSGSCYRIPTRALRNRCGRPMAQSLRSCAARRGATPSPSQGTQHRRHWRPRALTTARCPNDRFRLGQGWPGDPRRLQIQPVRAILDVHGPAFERG